MANIFLDRSNLIRTPVSALKIGVFVAELDRPWLETPFLVQGFVIKNQSEIRKLGQYCDYVYVEKQGRQWTKSDPFKSPMGIKRSTMGADDKGQHLRRAVSRKSLTATLGQRSSYEVSVKAPEEHAQAREIHLEARGAVVNILDQARMGAAIETETAKRVVKSCVESMLRNPHALMWMAKIKHADQYTLEHCLNVSILAIAFGRHLRLEKTDIEKLGICGLLHDVGKMQVPDEILNKPDKLTDEEMDVMRSHATLGRELLMRKKDAMTYTIDVTFNHHERVDGTGYPRGLHAHEISDFAKIITIVDAFDAMTSDRCYDEAKTSVDALREIYKARGTQFDEELALEFIQLIGPYPPGTLVELKNGKVGIAVTSEERKRHLPTVRVLLDENKQRIEPELVKLLDVESGKVDKGNLIARVLADGTHGLFLQDITDESVSSMVAKVVDPESDSEDDLENPA